MASDVREMLREFALKKMEELEKERETKGANRSNEVKIEPEEKSDSKSTEGDGRDVTQNFERSSGDADKTELKQSESSFSIERSDSNEKSDSNSSKDEKESKKSTKDIDEATNQKPPGIKINITTTKLEEQQNTPEDGDESESDSSSSSDGEEQEEEQEEESKPWREVPEEGELVDSTDDSQMEGKLTEKPEQQVPPGESGSKSKKKHKKHKKKSKKKKHKRDKEKSKGKENSKKDKDKKEKEKSEKSGKRKHSHRSRSRSKKHKKSKSRSKSRSRSADRGRDYHSHHTYHSYRSRSRDRYRYDESSYSRRHRDRNERYRSQSPRKREKTPITEFDKAKLLEIAKANAYAQQKAGLLPPNLHLPPPSKEEVASMKAGGKTIDELTNVCKKISEKQQEVDSSDEDPVNIPVGSDEEDTPFLHHPFQVKSHPLPIVMNIKNAVQKPVQDKDTLLLQFPVSSGTQHRKKESEHNHMDPYGEWVPVEKKEEESKKTDTASSEPVQSTADSSSKADSVTPPEDKESPPAKSENNVVFPTVQPPPVDISTMVSERLQAMRKLQHNPNDVEAMGLMYKANQQIQSWAQSGQKPGQFTGSTDAQMLRPEQLANSNPKAQAWAKKDMFHNTAPVRGGMGMYLLQKMGWKQGEGLGKNNEGSLLPLSLDVKTDRRGLVATGEAQKKKASVPAPIIRDLSGKHPVSALMEICNKRKWPPPEFTLEHDSGPDHKKNFVFKVRVNNEEYQPSIASPNKKHAKAQAATIALQKMGLIPMDYNVPQ